MNVLICVGTLSYAMGGVSTHILDLCKQYAHLDEVEKVVVCCDGGEHISALKEIPKVKYMDFPFETLGWFQMIIKGYFNIWRIVKKEKIKIIHVHSQRILPCAFLVKLFSGIPYIWTNHIDAIPNKRLFKLMCRVMRFPVISVSQELRNMMIKEYHCKPEKVFVVNNGTDLERFSPLSSVEKRALECRYGIERNKTPYVICLLSRIFYVKGHDQLLKALALLPERNKFKVIFAGHTYPSEIAYRDSLKKFAQENQIDLTILDYSSPRDIFGISDLFVLPSLFEGFALVCIEALAMGCAVIRSRTPGWQEMEPYVEVVEKNDIAGLKNKIQEVYKNNFNKDKTMAGQSAVRECYTKERCAEKTLEVYRKVIQGTCGEEQKELMDRHGQEDCNSYE